MRVSQVISEKELVCSILKRRESLFSRDIENNKEALTENIKGKSVLVIGGAGTIGASFIKAMVQFSPAKLVIVDINENGLTEIIRDLRSTPDIKLPDELLTYPVSFSSNVFKKIFLHHGPFEIVANFAAHKHVRSEKDIFSIEALIENNVLQAHGLMELLAKYKPRHFFCVSTDKAANPVNIMGASKKLMEDMIMAYAAHFKVTTARFANVAFSNGSLLDGFRRRIEKSQPLSCPDDVRRFFVSPEESGQICLMACMLGKSGEIFFPKLEADKDLVLISDILQLFLKAIGLSEEKCHSEDEAKERMKNFAGSKYPVFYSKTDSSGEKLYEEFYTDDEDTNLSEYEMLGVINRRSGSELAKFRNTIDDFRTFFSHENVCKGQLVALLKKYIPEFRHIETGIGLDSKM